MRNIKGNNKAVSFAMLVISIVVFVAMVSSAFAATSGNGETTNGEFSWTWSAKNDNDTDATRGTSGDVSGFVTGPNDAGVYTLTLQMSATSSRLDEAGCGADDDIAAANTTVTATITNKTGKAILIQSKTSTSATISGIPASNMLADGVSFSVQLIAKPNGNDSSENKDTITITYSLVNTFSVKFYGADNVQYSYANTSLSNSSASYTAELSAGSTIVLPTPTITNGAFYGWRMGDGSLRAAGETIAIGADTSFFPVVLSGSEQKVFEVDGNTFYFWEDAAYAAASSTTKQIVLIGDHTLPNTLSGNGVSPEGGMYVAGTNGDISYEIPNGCTFLLPYASGKTTVASSTFMDDSGNCNSTYKYANAIFTSDYNDNPTYDADGNRVTATDANGNTYIPDESDRSVKGVLDPYTGVNVTLTIPKTATLNVPSGSKLVIGGTIVAGTANTRGISGGTAAGHSNIQLDGTINIGEGGVLSSCGYVLGNGTVNVADGGEVYQPFTIMDHRDGHFAANSTGDNTFPLTRYTMNNIQCQLDITYGALMYGYIDVFTQPNSTARTQARHNVDCQLIIGQASGLIKLSSGASVTLTYDASCYVECANNNAVGYYSKVGRTTMTISGGASLGGFTISVYVPILGNQTSDSTKMVFPVPYNYNISLESGSYSLDNSMMLLPGATLTVGENAFLTVTKGTFIVFDGLRDYAHYGSSVAIGSWYDYHYPSTSDLRTKGTLKSNGTANFIVNGTFTVNSGASFGGYVQTTATTGQVVMNGTPSATTGIGHIGDLGGLYGYAVNDQAGRTTRTLAAILYKANGQTMTMETGKKYIVVGTAPNTIANYTYNVYTNSSSKDSFTSQTETLGATISGTWCISGSHTYTATVTNPTCTERGYTTHTCATCGDSYVDAYKDATGHSYDSEVTAPTCTAEGYTTYTCSGCGDTYTGDVKEANGHKNAAPVVENRKEPSCTAAGSYDSVVRCQTCGEEISRETVILKAQHTYTGNSVICTVCGMFEFKASNIRLGNNLDMLFAFPNFALDANLNGCYVKIVRTGEEDITIPVDQWRTTTIDGVDCYYVIYSGFAAKEMCDEVTVTVHDSTGKELSTAWVDSIRAYCDRMLSKYNETDYPSHTCLRTVIADMLNYGAACQVFFDYNTGNLANAGLNLEGTTGEISWSQDYYKPDNYYFFGCNLIADSNSQFVVGFTTAAQGKSFTYTLTNHWDKEVERTVSAGSLKLGSDPNRGQFYYHGLLNLRIADARLPFTVTIDGSSWTDSVESYCRRMTEAANAVLNDESATADAKTNATKTIEVMTAFMRFSDAAKAYLHSTEVVA